MPQSSRAPDCLTVIFVCAKSFMTSSSIESVQGQGLEKWRGFPIMSEDIDVLIERKETELSPFRSRMEELKIEFIKETVSFASEWYKRTAKIT